MAEDAQEADEQLLRQERELAALSSCSALLHWLWLEQVAAEMYGLILTITTERDIPKSVTT